MKKFLLYAFAISLSLAGVNAAEQNADVTVNLDKKPPCVQKMHKERINREKAFEQKLGLTEEQKVKAKELRKQGFEKIKPVMDQIKAKRQEVDAIKKSRIAVADQEKKIAEIDKELKTLEKQAHEIRKENMKEFESILTKDQRKTLKQMKKEGRENFKKNHPNGRPPMPPCKFKEVKN